MEKEFIPYEQALALKELGFDEPCMLNHYGSKRLHVGRLYLQSSFGKGRNSEIYEDSLRNGDITAILYQQAFRWFREKHDLHYTMHLSSKGYFGTITQKSSNLAPCVFSSERYNIPEKVELECLRKLIEIVKNGK